MASSSSKVKIEKFDSSNDFGLWKMKILAHLGNLGLDTTLGEVRKLLATMDDEKKEGVLKKPYNTFILCSSDRVLREILMMKLAAKDWLKLKCLCMTKNM